MPLYPHVIRRQYLHVEVRGTERDGLALLTSLPDCCQHRLMLAIEQIFERYAPQNEHLYIERLEIDAGAITLEGLEHDLAEAVSRALEKALREQPPARIMAGAFENSNAMRLITGRQAVSEAFIHFLTTGRLPWSFLLPADKNLEQTILDSWQEEREAGSDAYLINTSMLHAMRSATARQRLVRQFSAAFLGILLARFSSAAKTAMESILEVLNAADEQVAVPKLLEQSLWETAFAAISIGKAVTAEYIIGETWRTLKARMLHPPADLLKRFWPEIVTQLPEARTENGQIQPEGRLNGSELYRQETINTSAVATENPAQQRFDSGVSELNDMPEIKLLGINNAAVSGEGFYIDGAGLVLLHPFLPRFFEALGIAAEDALLHPERALCLLHFLTTGQSSAPEYALVLPKILCGIALEAPVDTNIALTEAEREEAAALLEAVIRHWEALRNTSADGLRGAFLLRPGKVSLRDGGDWLLQVEAKSFDILLQQLPWGIGMIKLPWMEKMLWVEWR